MIHLDDPSSSLISNTASSVSPSIPQRISEYFQLNNNFQRDVIVSALLNHGRQALFQFEDDLIPKLFFIEKNYTREQPDTPLLQLLKEYVYENLRNALEQKHSALFSLIKKEKQRNPSQFSVIERRLAEHGTSYKALSLVLFFVLQYLFTGIVDDRQEDRDISRQLFGLVVNEGNRILKNFEKYIAKDDLHTQLNNNQSLLNCTLRMFFGEEVKRLFNEHGISNTGNLYDLTVDNIIERGWIATIKLQQFQDKIPRVKYDDLCGAIRTRIERLVVGEQSDNRTLSE